MTTTTRAATTRSDEAMPVPEELDPSECFRLLRRGVMGRLAVRDETGVDVFPVNYLVHENAVYFRSAPGSKLQRLTASPQVGFEVDGRRGSEVWSVVVRGVARRLDSDEEILASGISEEPTALGGEKFNYVRIRPEQITGRRFRAVRRPRQSREETP